MNYEKSGKRLKIQKNSAKKLYDIGFPISLCPCKQSPDDSHIIVVTVDKNSGKNFESVVIDFTNYYCDSTEVGSYPSYYVPEVKGIHFEFEPKSNPYVSYGDINKILTEMNKLYKEWIVSIDRVVNGIVYAKAKSRYKRASSLFDDFSNIDI